MTTFDIFTYLGSKGCQLKRETKGNYSTSCFFHHQDNMKRRGDLWVLCEAAEDQVGMHQCWVCGKTGNLTTLMRHFGDEPPKKSDDAPLSALPVLKAAAKFYKSQLTEDQRATLQNERGLTDETIDQFRLGYAPGGTALWDLLKKDPKYSRDDILNTGLIKVDSSGEVRDALQNCLTIPYMTHGQVLQIRGRSYDTTAQAKYLTLGGDKARLFNADAAMRGEQVVICEGELDAMVLTQLGFDAVGVPGATSWQEHWSDYFANTKKVYAMFDPDEAGQRCYERLEKMNFKAIKIDLPVPDGVEAKQVDPCWLVGSLGWGQDRFLELMQESKRANSILITPAQAFRDLEQVESARGFKIGFESLDQWTKGLTPNQLMLVLAKTNAGKTLFLLNIMQRSSMIQPDARYLFVSLEQNGYEWAERVERLWNFYNLDCESAKVRQEAENYWQERLLLIEKSRLTEADLHESLDEYEEIMGHAPDLMLVDYLGYWAASFPGGNRYERVGDAAYSLKSVASDRKVPIIAPHQVNRTAEAGKEITLDAARDSGNVEETGDLIVGLWNRDAVRASGRQGDVGLEIIKARGRGKGQNISLKFGYMTLNMCPVEDVAQAKMLTREASWDEDAGLNWQDAIEAHKTGLKPSHRCRTPRCCKKWDE